MEFIRGQHNLRPRHHGCVATIGNFDGMHLGHQAILAQLAEPAAAVRAAALAAGAGSGHDGFELETDQKTPRRMS